MADLYFNKLIPSNLLTYTSMFALVIFGILFGIVTLQLVSIPLKWFIAILLGYGLISFAVLSGNARSIFLFLLILSAPIGFNYHITYRLGHVGIADGLTIEIIDIWLILIILIWLHNAVFHHKTPIKFYPSILIPFLLILLASFLSLFNTQDHILSAYGIVSILREFIFVVVIASSIRSKKDISTVLLGINASVLIIGIVSIIEVIFEVNMSTTFVLEKQDKYDNSAFRPAGLSTPTYTGAYLATVLPLMIIYTIYTTNKFSKPLLTLVITLGLTVLVLTLTRGAWICFIIGIIPMTFYLFRFRLIKLHHIIIPLLVILTIFILNKDRVFDRLSEGSGNVTARVGLIKTASNMIMAHPFVGIGINTYTVEMNKYTPDIKIHHFKFLVHNKYMLIWSEMGILALLAFLWLLGKTIINASKLISLPDTYIKLISIGLISSMTVVVFNMNMESYDGKTSTTMLWLVVGMVASLSKTYKIT